MKNIFSSVFPVIIFSLIISFPVILPYFHKGYFPTHDGEWAVVRLSDMFRELKDFQIPPRFSGNLNFGYGYPLFNFAYPFPYYLGFFIHLFKFNFVNSIKILFAASVFFSALFIFLASKKLWGSSLSGVISSILYIYLPYRFVDLYVRGSIGESISFALFPLIIFLILKQIETNKPFFFITTAFSYAVLIMTHNIMSILFTPLILIFVFSLTIFKKNIPWKHLIFSLFFGLLISAFFWVPALFEKQNILLSKIPIADRSLYFADFEQLLIPKWGYGVPTEKDGFTYQIGLPHLGLFLLTIIVLIYFYIRKKNFKEFFLFKFSGILIITSLVLIFLLFSQSSFIWGYTPFLKEINYPWTILAPLGFLLSLLAGFLTFNRITGYIALLTVIVAVIIFLPYAHPKYYFDRGDSFYFTNDATTTSSKELMPLWVKKLPIERPKNKVEILNGAGIAQNIVYNSKKINFEAVIEERTKLRINTIYYPGWKAYINGKESNIDYSNEKGVMDLSVVKGKSDINLIFTETPIRFASDAVSLIGFLFLLVLTVKFNCIKRNL